MSDHELDQRRYTVVVNPEEQYSIWLADKPLPSGWTSVGVEGTKDECLRHIERVWTDMRPRGVRWQVDRSLAW